MSRRGAWSTTFVVWATRLASLALVACGRQDTIPCDDPQPVLVDGQDTGFVECGTGWVHRTERRACPTRVPRGDFECPTDLGECATDMDCVHSRGEFCTFFDADAACRCLTGCVTDAECEEGQICRCGDVIGQCVEASCGNDGACEGGALCATYIPVPGCSGPAFTCQHPDDECMGDEDCPRGYQCTSNGEHRLCGAADCGF